MRNVNGIVSFFAASGKRAVTVSVSQPPSSVFLDSSLDSIVLYEADKQAHEEAVRNGGVSYCQCICDVS